MTIATGLIVSRFIHYLALSILFGGALFPFYGFGKPAADPSLRLTWLRPLLFGAALFTLGSGLFWFGFATADAGGTLSNLAGAKFLAATIKSTELGRVWPFRLLLATVLVLLLLGKPPVTSRRFYAMLLGSLILLASLAWTGHAGNDESSAALRHRIADAFHLIASGVWVGALVVLARLAMTSVPLLRDDGLQTLHDALARFSGVGTVVVATLTLTGIFNPGFSSSLQSAYGQVLLAKLAIFGAMLLLAAANRYWLTPRLFGTLNSASGLETAMRALRVSILTETALAVLVLLIVGWLGTLSPPPHQ